MGSRLNEMNQAWKDVQTLGEKSRIGREESERKDKKALAKLPPPKFVQYPQLPAKLASSAPLKATAVGSATTKTVQPDGTHATDSESSSEESSSPIIFSRSSSTFSSPLSSTSSSRHSSPSSPSSSSSSPQPSPYRVTSLSLGDVELPELPPEDDTGSALGSAPVTPREERSPASSYGDKMKKLRKRASKRISKLASELSEMMQKMSPRSGRNSPEKESPGRKASPGKDDGRLAAMPVADRKKNAVIDATIDLTEDAFADFVRSAAEAAFMKPWEKDTSDTTDKTGERKTNADKLQPTFVRDFENSDYFFFHDNGSQEKITTTDRFIELIAQETGDPLPRIVSNIASQNLGNFLKNVLFLRQNSEGNSDSVLRLWDDTPAMPIALAKASYVFSKNPAGDLVLDYEWKSGTELNGNKPLRVKKMVGDMAVGPVADASLRIAVRVTIAKNGEWHIGNPQIQASGWNVPLEE